MRAQSSDESLNHDTDCINDAMMRSFVEGRYLHSDDGSVQVPSVIRGTDTEERFDVAIKAQNEYIWRTGDFILATYPKNGTHFMWEIMMMLLRGTAEYIAADKNQCTIDMAYFANVEKAFPSERVLNTHFRFDVLPKQFRDRKTVLVIRNPKDTAVSFYPFFKGQTLRRFPNDQRIHDWLDGLTFKEFLHIFLYNNDQIYGLYFSYIEYMWQLAKDNPNILIIFFEDLKEEPLQEIEKVDRFMGTNCSSEVIKQISDATNFQKMKEGKSQIESDTLSPSLVYRKGAVGDWKNHFSVADNELFDKFLDNWSMSKEIPFRYTPRD